MSELVEMEKSGREIANRLTPVGAIQGEDEQDTQLLQQAHRNALRYISSFTWCRSVLDAYFGGGVGGIFTLFFFHIQSDRSEVDPWIWTMTGDIPPAYLPLSDCTSPQEAFEIYVDGMKRWIELARQGKSASDAKDVPPVNVPSTPEWAEQLHQRIETIERILPSFFSEDAASSL
jgi:hypothetical protein